MFDRLARTEGGGRFLGLPRVMFAIDRGRATPRVYWIDTRRYAYHFDFLQARYLTLADPDAFIAANYSRTDRRFILGAVARYPRLNRYGVELWEGDVIDAALLSTMMRELQARFHASLTFKPNSDQQEQAAKTAGLPTISVDQAYGGRQQLVLNPGHATGRLVLVNDGAEENLLPGDIALLTAMPIRLPPVSGVVSATFTTPINHVSLLAKTWGIPNVYQADALAKWSGWNGRQVVLNATGATITLRLATAEEARAGERAHATRAVRAPRVDLAYVGLPALTEQDASWTPRTGAKAANLGAVAHLARDRAELGYVVPPGFSIPFSFYEHFVAANGFHAEIEAFLDDPKRSEPAWRRAALARLRTRFASGRIGEADWKAILARQHDLFGSGGVFVRSSTNAEDLPGFNGAGLYDTVPNVTNADALAAAVKTVWGSLWNDRAFAARAQAGIDHRAVRPAVLVQVGIDADAAGVMTTIDPFEEQSEETRVFIAAKRGIGIRVVEGKKVAEQLIYRPDLDSIQTLTRSQDDVMLHFALDGGVQEVRVDPERRVLSDDLVRRLAAIGLAIQKKSGNRPQDVEWLVRGGQVMIVQSRDYVKGR